MNIGETQNLFVFRFSCVITPSSGRAQSCVFPPFAVATMMSVRLRILATLAAAVLASSDPPPSPSPVLRVQLSPGQVQTLARSRATFFYLCQQDPHTGGVHSSSLLRNTYLELVPYERVGDGKTDCLSEGARHADEGTRLVRAEAGDTSRRQERGLVVADKRQGAGEEWRVRESEGKAADTSGGYTGPGQWWGGLATELVLQSLFNIGLVVLTAAARGGCLGEWGQRWAARLMEGGRPRSAQAGSATHNSTRASPASHNSAQGGPGQQVPALPGPSGETEGCELTEVCVHQGVRAPPPVPVETGNGLPV